MISDDKRKRITELAEKLIDFSERFEVVRVDGFNTGKKSPHCATESEMYRISIDLLRGNAKENFVCYGTPPN